MTFKNGFRVWDDEYERGHWKPEEIADSKERVAQIGKIMQAERNGEISHDEAMIRHLMLAPDLAETMLEDAIESENKHEIDIVQRRIYEAKRRTREAEYWDSLITNAERTAQSGYNINSVIAIVSKALGILKSAVPGNA